MARARPATIEMANTTLLVESAVARIPEFFADDYVLHVSGRRIESGHDGVRRFVREIHRAFADLRVEVDILASTPARVTWRRTVSGRHDRAFRGFPPTGRRVTWRDMIVSEFRDGVIAEEWAVSDLAEGLLRGRKRPAS